MTKATRNLILSMPVPIIILLTKPFGLSGDQAIILAALSLTLTLWINKAVNRTYSSLFLIMVFLIFGNTDPQRVFIFPLSDNFILIVLSFLFSEGIVKSRLIDKLLEPYIGYYSTTLPKLFLSIWTMALIMIFIIPQPFIRLILLATIFREYLDSTNTPEISRKAVLLGVFMIAIITNTFFLKGDIIMNPALINMSGIAIGELQWTKYFLFPGMLHLLFTLGIYTIIHKNSISQYAVSKTSKPAIKLESEDKRNLALISIPLALWAFEGLHPIPGVMVIFSGVILMYLGKILKQEDVKSIQWSLLVFLTATFSIGPVMSSSGTAEILFGKLSSIFPQEYSTIMILAVIIASMLIHMILGSIVTTMSVVLPGMALLTTGVMSVELVSLIVFVTLALHFILPFHSVHLVVGEGYEFFDQYTVIRTGIFLTVIIFVSLFAFYIPWWNFVGLS